MRLFYDPKRNLFWDAGSGASSRSNFSSSRLWQVCFNPNVSECQSQACNSNKSTVKHLLLMKPSALLLPIFGEPSTAILLKFAYYWLFDLRPSVPSNVISVKCGRYNQLKLAYYMWLIWRHLGILWTSLWIKLAIVSVLLFHRGTSIPQVSPSRK